MQLKLVAGTFGDFSAHITEKANLGFVHWPMQFRIIVIINVCYESGITCKGARPP